MIESQALARIAEPEQRSQHDVIIAATREYIERSSRDALIKQVMNAELPRYADALE